MEKMVAAEALVVELIPVPEPAITTKPGMVAMAVMVVNLAEAAVLMVLPVYMCHHPMVAAAMAVMAAYGAEEADLATQVATLPPNNIVQSPDPVGNMAASVVRVVVAQLVLLLPYPLQKDPLELTPSASKRTSLALVNPGHYMEQLKMVFGMVADLVAADMVEKEETLVLAEPVVEAGTALPVVTQPVVEAAMVWGVVAMVCRYSLAMNPKTPMISIVVAVEVDTVPVVMALAALDPMAAEEAVVVMKTTAASEEMVFV